MSGRLPVGSDGGLAIELRCGGCPWVNLSQTRVSGEKAQGTSRRTVAFSASSLQSCWFVIPRSHGLIQVGLTNSRR